ncbi:hypothetical protein ANCDUO_04150 [Ancylostoma duodenale]|uniref:Uncharacterized protein n=1 Tax=Ancylostoma duodenale TaxID=51022 RepID=A0A0C2D7B7_9BILA|nr:hypothetical protein ANCDUO_04150 [Ancylostoma duodenale]
MKEQGGTFDLVLINFTVPETILDKVDSRENADKSEKKTWPETSLKGVIGFSLSRGNSIASGVGSNPHVCQLQQTDQGFDALFFFADLPQNRLRVFRSGAGRQIHLCPSHEECAKDASEQEAPPVGDQIVPPITPTVRSRRDGEGWLDKFKRIFSGGDSGKPYEDFVPLVKKDLLYSTNEQFRSQFVSRMLCEGNITSSITIALTIVLTVIGTQTDQGFDALFFFADLPQNRLRVFRSGAGRQIHLCPSHEECAKDASEPEVPPGGDQIVPPITPTVRSRRDGEGWLDKFKRIFSGGDSGKPYEDFVPLVKKDLLYSTNISIRFPYALRGKYHFIYHNCFNYRAHGYSFRAFGGPLVQTALFIQAQAEL